MLVYEYPELDALRGFLSSVPSISFGGCGFAAIAIDRCIAKVIGVIGVEHGAIYYAFGQVGRIATLGGEGHVDSQQAA